MREKIPPQSRLEKWEAERALLRRQLPCAKMEVLPADPARLGAVRKRLAQLDIYVCSARLEINDPVEFERQRQLKLARDRAKFAEVKLTPEYRVKRAGQLRRHAARCLERKDDPEVIARNLAKLPGRRAYSRAYQLHKRTTDASFYIACKLRMRINSALTRARAGKAARSGVLVGCTIRELMRYLEDRFHPGMSWDNRSEWHIDHKRPCSSFDLRDPVQQLECFNYTNLQPLWKRDNLKKGKKWQISEISPL